MYKLWKKIFNGTFIAILKLKFYFGRSIFRIYLVGKKLQTVRLGTVAPISICSSQA